jgi:hypothetical protein
MFVDVWFYYLFVTAYNQFALPFPSFAITNRVQIPQDLFQSAATMILYMDPDLVTR